MHKEEGGGSTEKGGSYILSACMCGSFSYSRYKAHGSPAAMLDIV